MIVIHANWTSATLHLWGERVSGPVPSEVVAPRPDETAPIQPDTSFLSPDELRDIVGDLWDSLLASGASDHTLRLVLPHRGGLLLPSFMQGRLEGLEREGTPSMLEVRTVPTLAFGPADSIDLLTARPMLARDHVRTGPSLTYWSRAAELVLELLAQQRFVPAVHADGTNSYRGYWRVVVDDKATSDRLRALIAAMPPSCRCLLGDSAAPQASRLIENFLWTTVDALVRRCLEGDELANAVHDVRMGTDSALRRWLRSLVGPEAAMPGTTEDCRNVHDTVRDWLHRLEPGEPARKCVTCFRLHAPSAEETAQEAPWRLTFHLQAVQDRALVLDAANLATIDKEDPAILERPFDHASEQLRADLARASRHFPPLAPCAEPGGPVEAALTLSDAHRFLRDVAPVLEAEGLPVWAPGWWRDDRPRLRFQLDLRPTEEAADETGPGMRLDALIAYDWRVALGDEDVSLEEITRLAETKEPLIRLKGRWTEVRPADLATALSFLHKNPAGKTTLFDALRLSYTADDLETGLPIGSLRAHGWIERLLNASNLNEHLEEFPPPPGFEGVLRPYQLKGLQWLSFLAKHGLGACLADDMGLGKTIQLIALLLHERDQGRPVGPTLLIVPMSLVGNWQREIARFGPSLQVLIHHGLNRLTGQPFVEEAAEYDVVISTYGLAHRDFEHLRAVDWHRIALDEAQNTKNPAAKQSVAIRSLQAVHRVALTGTPVENRLGELWSIIDFLNPGYLGPARDFRRRFAVPVERHHDTERADRLRNLIRPFVLRRRKDDPNVLEDLPDKLEMNVFCNLTREQAALYEAVVTDMLRQVDGAAGIQRRGLILATLVKLKQICNHPSQFLDDGGPVSHRSGKCDRITEMLDEVVAEGDRALVFTQFREMGHILEKHLRQSLGKEVLFLHGGTTQKNRVTMIERFQEGNGDAPVFILSLKAGGFGLNLTAANHVFLFDRWWNPAVETQAADRAHRIGQHRQVQVHKFVCVGTLEEWIAELIEKKRNLAETVIGSGESWLTELSTDALRDVLRLSRDAVAED